MATTKVIFSPVDVLPGSPRTTVEVSRHHLELDGSRVLTERRIKREVTAPATFQLEATTLGQGVQWIVGTTGSSVQHTFWTSIPTVEGDEISFGDLIEQHSVDPDMLTPVAYAPTTVAEALAAKADLVDDVVPDEQLPERLGEENLSATFAPVASGRVASLMPLPSRLNSSWLGYASGRSVTTARGFEYAIYVGSDARAYIAQRPVDSPDWDITSLESIFGIQGADGHNYYSVGVDSNGYVHVSGNMHAQALLYAKSAAPDSIASFATAAMVGAQEDAVSYPDFQNLADGTLIFVYRNGGSGAGDTYLNRYNGGVWSRVATLFTGLSGSPQRSVYSTVTATADGALHATMIWRDTSSPDTNHDLGYMRSIDGGTTWSSASGAPVAVPVTFDVAPTIFPTAATGSGLLNSATVDATNGVPHVAVLAYDGDGFSNVLHLWYSGGVWHDEFVTFDTVTMSLSAAIVSGIVSRPGIICRNGRTYIIRRTPITNRSQAITAVDVTVPGSPVEFTLLRAPIGYLEPQVWDTAQAQLGRLKVIVTPQPAGGAAGGYLYESTWGAVLSVDLDRIDSLRPGGSNAQELDDVSAALAADDPARATFGVASAAQLVPGNWYAPRGLSRTTQQAVEGTATGTLLTVGRTTTITQVACNVTVAGSAGAVVRMAVYRMVAGSFTATLLADSGPVSATTVGQKAVAINAPVTAGETLWLAVVAQGAATTRPTLTAINGQEPAAGVGSVSTIFSTAISGYSRPGVTGAFPASVGLFATGTSLMAAILAAA